MLMDFAFEEFVQCFSYNLKFFFFTLARKILEPAVLVNKKLELLSLLQRFHKPQPYLKTKERSVGGGLIYCFIIFFFNFCML